MMKRADQILIEEKLNSTKKFMLELAPFLRVSRQQFEREIWRQRVVERLTQIVVECAIDTNALLVQALNLPTPQHAKESFQILNQQGALDDVIMKRYVDKYVGLRNVIVHLYEKVEARSLYYSAHRLLKDADVYIEQIQKFLAPPPRNVGNARRSVPSRRSVPPAR